MSKYDKVMIECAEAWAEQSYCEKAQVGAVLSLDGRIIATGYNGTVHGLPNICEIEMEYTEYFCCTCFKHSRNKNKCDYCGTNREDDTIPFIRKELKTSPFTVHAEQNVLTFCAKEGIATDGATMYITLSPCANCAKLMVQSGIKRVVYLKEYKDKSGIDFLKTCNVEVMQYEECLYDK